MTSKKFNFGHECRCGVCEEMTEESVADSTLIQEMYKAIMVSWVDSDRTGDGEFSISWCVHCGTEQNCTIISGEEGNHTDNCLIIRLRKQFGQETS